MKVSLFQKIHIKRLFKKLIKTAEQQYDTMHNYTGQSPENPQIERKKYVAEQLITVSRLEEIYSDSYNLIRTTTNPKTFFGRYDDAMDMLKRMLDYAIPNGLQAKKLQERVNELEQEKEYLIIAFIDRSIQAGKVELLKDTMWAYEDKMTYRSISYLKLKIGEIRYPKQNKAAKYIYCDVAFTPTGKTYYYRTEDQSLDIGDIVLVPTGPYSKETVGIIRHIGWYEENDVPFPLKSTRVIIGKCDKSGKLVRPLLHSEKR